MGFVYLNVDGLGLRLNRVYPSPKRHKRFDWVSIQIADVFRDDDAEMCLQELSFVTRKRVIREIAKIKPVKHKLVLVDPDQENEELSDAEYYRKGMSDAFNLLCDGLNVDSEYYDRDQSDVECILDAVKDAAEMLKSFGVKFDKEAWGFSNTSLTLDQLRGYVNTLQWDKRSATENGFFESAEGLERALEVLEELVPLALDSGN